MLIYGTGEIKHPSSPSAKSKCPECGEYEVSFHFFKKYVHLFWIPTFPYGSRNVAYCEKCRVDYQDSIPESLRSDLERARSRASFPWLVFSGLAILIVGITALTYLSDGKTTQYYPSDKKQAEGKYVNGKQEGNWTWWHENGKVQSEQNYLNGLEEGEWTWYNEQGIKTKSGGYHKGRYHGKWVFYSDKGELLEEYMFVDNRKHGLASTYYERGTKSSEGNYDRDLPQGKWTFWYENQNKMMEGEYVDGKQSGLWKYYFENGKLSGETEFKDSISYVISSFDKDGGQMVKNGNGLYSEHYESGQKSSEGHVKNGLYDGSWTLWYPNGKVKEVGTYATGGYTLLTSFDPEGNALVVAGNGYHKSYYENGIVAAECLYRNGKLNGLLLTRDADGTTLLEANYHDGKYEGEFKNYHETGELISKGSFKNNVQVGVWTWFHLNGNKEAEANFINGKKEGEETFWSESGEIVKREYYKNGKLIREEAY
jgi:antitoxin component YwqK of YwqJK toxin-antitoxin module